MQELFEASNRLLNSVEFNFRRYLYTSISWNARLIELNGARGVGKTTLMLQKAKELNSNQPNQAIYFSLDDPYFFKNDLVETIDEVVKYGVKFVFLDEVHKYPSKYKEYDWSAELKNIYDKFPQLSVVYSGSSILKLYKAQGDLSRRRVVYNLAGLSLREYLIFNGYLTFESVSLDEILRNHIEISNQIISQITIIPHFKQYLLTGYYPFYNEIPEKYDERLKSIISVILENDIPAVMDIPYETTSKLKKLLAVIAGSVPYTPNLTKVGAELYIADLRTLLKYFDYLEKAELITTISKDTTGNQILRKPDKVYLNNPNLLQCFDYLKSNIGTTRETFFLNQVSKISKVKYPAQGDFLLNDTITVEVGGKSKKRDQIKNVPDAILAVDDIEVGFGKTIPLWLFGFLY